MKITVGVQLGAGDGDYPRLRDAWREADELGADYIYVSDHFFPPTLEPNPSKEKIYGKNFEAMSLEAAMAATTKHAQIGCLVHSNSYRNPQLLADMARTVDHISGGRFVLGIGSGWYKLDYDEYGYEFGTAGSRLRDLERDLPLIKSRLGKLNPPPLRKIPIVIGGGGEKMTLKLVAQYADIWHFFGDPATMKAKSDILDDWCGKVGRNPREITRSTSTAGPAGLMPKVDPSEYLKVGFTDFIAHTNGPDWDLKSLRELIDWKRKL
jgi:probable F420-dependent oxidoreductase